MGKITITIDTDLYKVAPIKETPEWRANLTEIGYSHKSVIADVMAAVPANLPGVVAHSGEPVAVCAFERECDILWLDNVPNGAPLFTHPPEPANAIAIAQAALEAAANRIECGNFLHAQSPEAVVAKSAANSIRAINPQSIIDAATKGQS